MGDKSKTLLLFWEAIDYNKTASDQLDYSFDTVIAGNHDDYFKKFVTDAKAYGGEIILVPYSEFNGDWHPWSTTKEGNTPEKFIKSWIYIHSFFTDVPNVKFAWVPNSGSIPNTQSNQFELNYPGSRYVDYVGVDGFNFGVPWESFNVMFGKSLPRLEKFGKPVYIFSMGVTEDVKKKDWIIDAFTVQLHKYPYVKGWLWFNENKDKDWRINSSSESLEAFKKILN
jgi:beta-mannanase